MIGRNKKNERSSRADVLLRLLAGPSQNMRMRTTPMRAHSINIALGVEFAKIRVKQTIDQYKYSIVSNSAANVRNRNKRLINVNT